MPRRIIVAANRLPVNRVDGGWEQSPGGLVSALTPILQETGGVWIGWSGSVEDHVEPFELDGISHVPVSMSHDEVDYYYLGFSNETIWPLFHDAIRTPDYHRHWWRSYLEVNGRFAEAIAAAAQPDDLIWIHDYQLLLVPQLLRELAPELESRFFLHIPFPPVELYARLPWRTQIIEGLLGADVVGFQTERSAGNFINAATAFTGAGATESQISRNGHESRVVATPISIDTEGFEQIARAESTRTMVDQIRNDLGNPDVILLGADRLDYSKGINVRLRAFETLLELDQTLADRLKFVQIGVPSRAAIGDYADIKREIEQVAGRINSMYGSRHKLPVHYIYESLTPAELVAYYRAADVMVVTPFADGMNLVAKEYVASRIHGGGVLLLSEFAGTAREFGNSALLANPYDIDGLASLMMRAITMDPDEGRRRMETMRKIVREHDVHKWARLALGSGVEEVAPWM